MKRSDHTSLSTHTLISTSNACVTVAVRADLNRDYGDFTPGSKGGGNEEGVVVIASLLEAI